jgi:hypothetical protein
MLYCWNPKPLRGPGSTLSFKFLMRVIIICACIGSTTDILPCGYSDLKFQSYLIILSLFKTSLSVSQTILIVKWKECDRSFVLRFQGNITMKSIIFWDMTPCSPLSFNRRFCFPPACSLICWTYFFDPEDGGDMLKLNGLHGVISQKMILFITTAVKTSNPT